MPDTETIDNTTADTTQSEELGALDGIELSDEIDTADETETEEQTTDDKSAGDNDEADTTEDAEGGKSAGTQQENGDSRALDDMDKGELLTVVKALQAHIQRQGQMVEADLNDRRREREQRQQQEQEKSKGSPWDRYANTKALKPENRSAVTEQVLAALEDALGLDPATMRNLPNVLKNLEYTAATSQWEKERQAAAKVLREQGATDAEIDAIDKQAIEHWKSGRTGDYETVYNALYSKRLVEERKKNREAEERGRKLREQKQGKADKGHTHTAKTSKAPSVSKGALRQAAASGDYSQLISDLMGDSQE